MTPRGRATIAAAAAAALLAGLSARAQAPRPAVRIFTPVEGTYVADQVIIRAAIDPVGTPVERMIFYGDGRVVCTVLAAPFECVWNIGPDVRRHDVRVVAILRDGRRAVPGVVSTKGLAVALDEYVDLIEVVAVVLDGSKFVSNLPRTAFRVYEDDVPRPISYFGSTNVDLELVAGVDISESMTRAIDQMKEAVKRFLSALRPEDRVTIFAFNESPFQIAAPAASLAARLKAVDMLAPWGATALHDVIIRGFDSLSRQQARRGLVVFTDGDDTASRVSAAAVERRAETSGAVLFMIGQGQALTGSGLRKLCERLAQKSGGRAFFPAHVEELDEVFDRILEDLSNQYYFTFAPRAPRDDKYHRIRVEVDGYEVRTRSGYRWDDKRLR